MTPEILAEIAAEANQAPSVHNTQPVRWQMDGADGVILSLDPRRRLSVGDPTGQDARLSGGAALEGTKYALWRRGIGLRGIEDAGDNVRIALGGEAGGKPPAAATLARRCCYRAGFAAADSAQIHRLTGSLGQRGDATLFRDRSAIEHIAELNDAVSLTIMQRAEFRDELRSWMRLSRSHRDWSRDGLSAEALAMTGVEALGANIVLRRPVFDALALLGLAGSITAEAAKTKSATAILAFHRPADEDRWTSGAAFYALWLALTEAGFAAWPMAALVDDATARAEISGMAGLADDRALVMVLRIGPHPGHLQPARARLPGAELVTAT